MRATESSALSSLSTIKAGFADPVHDAQHVFRTALDALARPGAIATIHSELVPPSGFGIAQAALLLALTDYDTPVFLDDVTRLDEAAGFLRFHAGCPITADIGTAYFVVLTGLNDLPPLEMLRLGEAAYPDRSATLIIEVSELYSDGMLTLRGPGIETIRTLHVSGWGSTSKAFFSANHASFPRGVDLILTCGNRLVGLPRTTIVEG